MGLGPKKTVRSSEKSASEKLAVPAPSSNLSVSAQILNFEPGTYTIEVGAQTVQVGPAGFRTPCVRLDTLHHLGTTPTAFFSALGETSLITPGGAPAFMRVTGTGSASVLLTVYRFENMPAPEIRVRLLEQNAIGSKTNEVEPPAPAESEPETRASLIVHIEGVGDRSVPIGSWGGMPGSGRTIEGFVLRVEAGSPEAAFEYQAALGLEWDTPWFPTDEFCGSRGMMLPLLGVRIRAVDKGSEQLVCRYWGSFVGLGERGPFEQGALCACNGVPLEALRIELLSPDKSKKSAGGSRRRLLSARR